MITMVSLKLVFSLLVVYQIKHWVCDYPLQNDYMMGKFRDKGWITPLALHAAVHAYATLLISTIFFEYYLRPTQFNMLIPLGLAVFDFVIHFSMDRIKASSKMLGRYKVLSAKEYLANSKLLPNKQATDLIKGNKYYFYSLGIDQAVHHLTHYAIIFYIIYTIMKFSGGVCV